MARVAAHRQLADAQVDVVAVRADEIDPAVQFGRPRLGQLGQQSLGERARFGQRILGRQFGQRRRQ